MVPSQVRPTAAAIGTNLLQFQGGLITVPSLYGVRSRYGHSCYPYLASATTHPLGTEGGANLGSSSSTPYSSTYTSPLNHTLLLLRTQATLKLLFNLQ